MSKYIATNKFIFILISFENKMEKRIEAKAVDRSSNAAVCHGLVRHSNIQTEKFTRFTIFTTIMSTISFLVLYHFHTRTNRCVSVSILFQNRKKRVRLKDRSDRFGKWACVRVCVCRSVCFVFHRMYLFKTQMNEWWMRCQYSTPTCIAETMPAVHIQHALIQHSHFCAFCMLSQCWISMKPECTTMYECKTVDRLRLAKYYTLGLYQNRTTNSAQLRIRQNDL